MDPDMIKRPNEVKYFQILQCHKLILSQTSGVNLMTVPNHVVELIKESIANYKADVGINKDVLAITEIEQDQDHVPRRPKAVSAQFGSSRAATVHQLPQGPGDHAGDYSPIHERLSFLPVITVEL